MKNTFVRFVPPAAGVALGAVFLFAAGAKGGDAAAFAEQVESHGIISGIAARGVAYLLIPIEAVLGAALLFGLYRRAAAMTTGALLVFFIAVTAYAWSLGKTEGCGCFGAVASRTPGEVIVEDILLIGLAGLAALPWRGRQEGHVPRGRFAARARWAAVVLCGAGAIAYELAAPALPIDDYVTALRPGRNASDLGLGVEGSEPRLVALLDLKSERTGEAVPALNLLVSQPSLPRTVAFVAATEDERMGFFWKFGPTFELQEVSAQSLRPLYRKLPRLFLVVRGQVVKTWNDRIPSPAEVASSLPPEDGRSGGSGDGLIRRSHRRAGSDAGKTRG